jgi:chitinase
LFGGGSSSTRPFGNAIIDGVDLDIEGGASTGYASLVTDLRTLFNPIKPNFLVGSAPQCPFPDAILGSVINAVGFDYVNVQFYNNYCSAAGNSFNFNTWANWATTTSPNKNVKVMFTIPGSSGAAGSGYVPISTLQSIVPSLASTYPGPYGGVSVWDASQAYGNSGFASSLYSLVKSGSGGSGSTTTTVKTTTTSATKTSSVASTTTTSAPTSTATSGTCVTAGQTCTTSGQYVCTANGAYAVCDHNAWVVTPCPSGTVCIPTADGSSIYCGYASAGATTCTAVSARAAFKDLFNKGAAVPKPYTTSQVTSQLTIISSTATEFEAVLNARRTVATPFGQQVTIEFTAPSNVKYTSVDSGSVRQVGTSVRVQAQNTGNATMAMIVDLKGTVSSGIFVAPNPASVRFK